MADSCGGIIDERRSRPQKVPTTRSGPSRFRVVEAVLRRYVESASTPACGAVKLNPDGGHAVRRGASAPELWMATVGAKLARDPNRVRRDAWEQELRRLLDRRRSVVRMMPHGELDELLDTAAGPTSSYTVNLAEIWAWCDAGMHFAGNGCELVTRVDLRSGGRLQKLVSEVRVVAGGWQEVVQFIADQPGCEASMEWLADAFAACAVADPSFLGWCGGE